MDTAATISAVLLALLFGSHAYQMATGTPMQRTSANTLQLPYERSRLVANWITDLVIAAFAGATTALQLAGHVGNPNAGKPSR
jgi:hypothetical protein